MPLGNAHAQYELIIPMETVGDCFTKVLHSSVDQLRSHNLPLHQPQICSPPLGADGSPQELSCSWLVHHAASSLCEACSEMQ